MTIEQRPERGRVADAARGEQLLVGDVGHRGTSLVEPAQRDQDARARVRRDALARQAAGRPHGAPIRRPTPSWSAPLASPDSASSLPGRLFVFMPSTLVNEPTCPNGPNVADARPSSQT